MPLGMELGLSPGDCVRWTKTPLEIDLRTGHIVDLLDGVPAPREMGTAAPSFWPVSIVATAAVTHLSYC